VTNSKKLNDATSTNGDDTSGKNELSVQRIYGKHHGGT